MMMMTWCVPQRFSATQELVLARGLKRAGADSFFEFWKQIIFDALMHPIYFKKSHLIEFTTVLKKLFFKLKLKYAFIDSHHQKCQSFYYYHS